MYYQVLVEIKEKIGKSNQNKEITVLDVESRDEVLNDIVIPYLNNEEFVFNGYMLNKREINKLIGQTKEKGYSLIPLNVHIKNGWIKLDIALARGKKNYDKRDSMLEKEHERNIQYALKNKYK